MEGVAIQEGACLTLKEVSQAAPRGIEKGRALVLFRTSFQTAPPQSLEKEFPGGRINLV